MGAIPAGGARSLAATGHVASFTHPRKTSVAPFTSFQNWSSKQCCDLFGIPQLGGRGAHICTQDLCPFHQPVHTARPDVAQ